MEIIKDYVAKKKQALADKISSIKTGKLVIVQVGQVPASCRYVRNKIKDCQEVGIECQHINFDDDISQNFLIENLKALNADPSVSGYIVQLPLPARMDTELISSYIDPAKDIDGFHPLSKTVPATPLGIYKYLKDQNFEFAGKNAVVIGRSNIVGRPMAKLLLDESMNVTVCHSKTPRQELANFVKSADLIVVATGHRNTLTCEGVDYKRSAVVIDVGINVQEDGKLCGDCEPGLSVSFQSPVPGGVGLLTRLAVIDNFITLVEANNEGK